MTNNFKEKQLSADFRKKDIEEIQKLIVSSTSFQVLGMPGMGISIFLRYLATQDWAHFLHIDINELPTLSVEELLKATPKREDLEKLVQQYDRVVLIFNRFDNLKPVFTKQLFSNLRSLRDVDKEKIVMIFAVNYPLVAQFPELLDGGSLTMYSPVFNLTPYSPSELKSLVKLNSPQLLNSPYLNKALFHSQGHYQLLQLLLRSTYSDPLEDPIVQRQLKIIQDWQKPPKKDLSYKEEKLLALLKENEGKVVSKEEIFAKIWPEDSENATDWALDALIYRIRKNPKTAMYRIQSKKKQGYKLVSI